MLQASFSHAGQDKLARQLAEQRLAARQLVEGLEAALAADGDTLLDADECAALRAQMVELQALMETDDVDAMRRLTDKLGRSSEAFAARRMDKSIRQALAGVSLDSLDEEVME
jgi:molecular chaperone HscA